MSKWTPTLALLFSISKVHLHARVQTGTSFEKKNTSIISNRLYFITLDKENWEKGLMKRNLKEVTDN